MTILPLFCLPSAQRFRIMLLTSRGIQILGISCLEPESVLSASLTHQPIGMKVSSDPRVTSVSKCPLAPRDTSASRSFWPHLGPPPSLTGLQLSRGPYRSSGTPGGFGPCESFQRQERHSPGFPPIGSFRHLGLGVNRGPSDASLAARPAPHPHPVILARDVGAPLLPSLRASQRAVTLRLPLRSFLFSEATSSVRQRPWPPCSCGAATPS